MMVNRGNIMANIGRIGVTSSAKSNSGKIVVTGGKIVVNTGKIVLNSVQIVVNSGKIVAVP